jgi:RimJ/RimL family protein N-acetyltransferase
MSSGFKEEGVRRRGNLVDGHWEDIVSMGVLDDEWLEWHWSVTIPESPYR